MLRRKRGYLNSVHPFLERAELGSQRFANIANRIVFGEDRTHFRRWHDKPINAISQHFSGVRELFLEINNQLTANKTGLTYAEWQTMRADTESKISVKFDNTVQYEKFNEHLYYISQRKRKAILRLELSPSK